jgi:hypothetical protein
MKKFFCDSVIAPIALGSGLIVLVLSLVCLCNTISSPISSIRYNQRCEILAKYGSLISVVRADGNIYDFEDEEDVYNVGDKVIVTFDTNGSKEDVFDDKIVKVEILK